MPSICKLNFHQYEFIGYDKLDNLVLDDSIEFLRGMDWNCYLLPTYNNIWYNFSLAPVLLDPNDLNQLTDRTRPLGLVICRGTQVSLICPSDEMQEIANPFAEDEEVEEGEGAIEEGN